MRDIEPMPVYPWDTGFAMACVVDAKYRSVSGNLAMFPQTPGTWHSASRIGAGSVGVDEESQK